MSEAFIGTIIEKTKAFCHDKIGLDIGANYGSYTSAIAKFCLNVYAFEPGKDNFRTLQEKVTNPNVTFVNQAVSNEDGVIKLYHCGSNPGGHSIAPKVYNQTVFGHKLDDFEEVFVTKLDTYFEGRTDIGFMKIDVEAAELMVLEGATQILSTNKVIIALETHQTTELNELMKSMQQREYVFLDENFVPVVDRLHHDHHYCIHNLGERIF